jgi:hypothetical protein
MNEWYIEFRKLVINRLSRINPRSVTEEYFVKAGQLDLWNSFLENTKHLDALPLTKRVKFLEFGHFSEYPKCYCGAPVSIIQNKVSKYCSQKCQLSAPERCAKISATKKLQDHTVSNSKRKETMMMKYGHEYNSQRGDIHHIWTKSKLKKDVEDILLNYDWMFQEYEVNKRTGVDIGEQIGCFYGTVLEYCKKHGFKIRQRSNYSLIESKLDSWLSGLDIKHEMGIYDIISPYELDCVIPDYKVAIEINGLHWHNERFKPKDFHLMKSILANNSDYFLFHFTDWEWTNKNDIVKSMILSKLNRNMKIGARQCLIKEITGKESRKFLEENHIQGYAVAKYTYGLFYNDELIMLASFGRPRFNKHYEWEIIRVSTKQKITVVGGISKLLNAFKNQHEGSIITYVDRKYGNGKGFKEARFEHIGDTSPGYIWTDGNIQISRYRCQKSNLSKWLPSYDSSLSEAENMTAAKYHRIWDCGQMLFKFL